MEYKKINISVIGAGPAGITAAYELAKGGARVTVFEAGLKVGGLAQTIDLWGQKVDLGPHRFFSSDTRVNKLWLEVVGGDYSMVKRLTRILYQDKFFHYPLRPFNALINLGPLSAAKCLFSYFIEKIHPTPLNGTFENWVTHRFGRQLFETFFKTYSEKLWGISCRDLDADFAAQRIKKLSLLEAVKNAFGGRRLKHKTLVDEFAYPHGGTGIVYERMAQKVVDLGGKIHLNTPILGVLIQNGRAVGVECANGSQIEADHVISTMPLTPMVQKLNGLPESVSRAAEALTFRNTIIVFLKVEGTDLFHDNWVYINSPEFKTGRVTNFRNWVPQINQSETETILAAEYWCYDGDKEWTAPDMDLIDLASCELRNTGLIGDAKISAGHVRRLKRCYPVYRKGYLDHLNIIISYLKSIDCLHVIGRYGSFKYNNQDHSILMGILAAQNILHEKKHNLWGINTDYENYQESSVITETGLVDDRHN